MQVVGFFNNYLTLAQSNQLLQTALTCLVLYAAIRLISERLQHRHDRRMYKYQRSSTINSKRFRLEIKHIENLTELFLQLLAITLSLGNQASGNTNKKIRDDRLKEWNDTYKKALDELGKSAVSLNYLDLSTGEKTCSVHCDSADNSDDEHRKSLFVRGKEFLNCCVDYLEGMPDISADKMIYGLFRFEDKDKDVYRSLNSLPTTYKTSEEYLQDRYYKFCNCAYCRVRSCETGTRDAKKENRKAKWSRWREETFPWIFARHLSQCPFSGNDNNSSNESESENWKLIWILISLLVIAVMVITAVLVFDRIVISTGALAFYVVVFGISLVAMFVLPFISEKTLSRRPQLTNCIVLVVGVVLLIILIYLLSNIWNIDWPKSPVPIIICASLFFMAFAIRLWLLELKLYWKAKSKEDVRACAVDIMAIASILGILLTITTVLFTSSS